MTCARVVLPSPGGPEIKRIYNKSKYPVIQFTSYLSGRTYGRSYLHIYLWSVIEGLGIVACRCSTEEDIYIIPTALFAAAVGLRAVRLIEQRIIGSG